MQTKNIDFITPETKNVKWIVDNLNHGLLFVDNSFQRNYVWLLKHQIRLIETILIGFPIPEIYIWSFDTDPDTGETKYSIVDGQQRFGAVKDFINGKFRLVTKFLEFKKANYANKNFRQLEREERNLIWKYPFTIRIIKENVKKTDIVKMFLRLNSTNMTLNPQELRKAEFGGLFLRLADEIADNTFWEKYNVFSRSQIRRMTDIQFMSSILMFFRLGIEEETTQRNINRVYDLYNKKYEEYDEDKKMFLKTIKGLRKFINSCETEAVYFLRKQTHLYTLIVTIYYIYKKQKTISLKHIKNFKILTAIYYSDTFRGSQYTAEQKRLYREYKKLSLEGTQRKANRMRRSEVMRLLLGVDKIRN